MREPRPVIIVEAARTQTMLIETPDRSQHTHRKLSATHLHGENRDRQTALYRDRLADIHGKRSLAHGRSSRDDDQITGLQARGHAIEINNSGRPTGDLILVIAVVEFINTLDHLREQRLNFLKALGSPCALFSDRKNFGFSFIQHLLDFFTLRIESQHTTIANNLCIATNIGGRRRVLSQRIEISNATGIFCLGR